MQQFWYRNATEYDAHVQQMMAAGWTMTHHQPNADGTTSATWAPPQPPQVRPTTNRSDITKIAIITGAVVLFIVIAVLVNGGTSSGTNTDTAKSTPSLSAAESSARLDSCMRSSWGSDPQFTPSWFQSIRDYQVNGQSVTVHTTLFHKDENVPEAKIILNSVGECAISSGTSIRSVFVRASNDVNLAFGSVRGR